MKSQIIKTAHTQAEILGHDSVLVIEAPHESLTVRGHAGKEVDVTLLVNEREMFHGSATVLETGLEALRALQNLRTNHTIRQTLTQLADNGDATAVLRFLNLVN